MLATHNLEYSYDKKAVLTFPDIQCREGEHWLLLGQSGSGKTTLLHLLGGLLSPQKGTVKVAREERRKTASSSGSVSVARLCAAMARAQVPRSG